MAIYFKEPKVPTWISGLNAGLNTLGIAAEVGYGIMQQQKAQKELEQRQSDLESAGYNPQEAQQIARAGQEYTVKALMDARQRSQENERYRRYAEMVGGSYAQQPQQQAPQMAPEPLGQLGGLAPQQQISQEPFLGIQEQQSMTQSPEDRARKGIEAAMAVGLMSVEEGEKRLAELEGKRYERNVKSYDTHNKFIEKVYDSAQAADDNLHRLDRLEEIGKFGDINDPMYLDTLKYLGIEDYNSLLKPDTKAYNKIVTDFLSGAKSMFGSRVTEGEIRMFMKRLPQATLDPVARKQVIEDLRYFFKAQGAQREALDQIQDENPDRLPKNLHRLVDKRTRELTKEYADKISFLKNKPGQGKQEGKTFASPELMPKNVKKYRDRETGQIMVRDPRTGQFVPEDELRGLRNANISQANKFAGGMF